MTAKLWFKAKTYGWGWVPCSWEGWLVILFAVLFLVWDFRRIDSVSHSVSDTLHPFSVDALFIFVIVLIVCYWKGETPRWRWGGEEDK